MTSTDPTRYRVVLDLEPTARGIRGVLHAERGAPRPFQGWLELAGMLEQFRPHMGDPPDDSSEHRSERLSFPTHRSTP
ncbi:MAG: hypothetical protein ABI251_01445 [Mycobacteriaceae bacterium]